MSAGALGATKPVAVAASQTASVLSSGVGTYLARLIVTPETTAPGVVTLLDGTGSGLATYPIYVGGTYGADLTPFVVEVHAKSQGVGATSQGWRLTTGANVSVVAIVQPR